LHFWLDVPYRWCIYFTRSAVKPDEITDFKTSKLFECWDGRPLAVFLLGDILAICVGCKSLSVEYAVVLSVEALRYKSEGRGFGSRWSHFH
jgi:hypothetical protein